MTYQLDDVAGLEKGTYVLFVQARHVNSPSSLELINFQVARDCAVILLLFPLEGKQYAMYSSSSLRFVLLGQYGRCTSTPPS
jgi:hypothetical protein